MSMYAWCNQFCLEFEYCFEGMVRVTNWKIQCTCIYMHVKELPNFLLTIKEGWLN